MKQLSFNNDSILKAELVAMAKHHAQADMLLKGTFGKQSDSGFRGCSVGCFAHDINPKSGAYHQVLAEKAGLPLWLIHMQDFLFERSKNPTEFHVEFFQRIPVGVDLQFVLHKITIHRMQRLLDVQSKAPESSYKKQVCAAVEKVKALYEKYPDFSTDEAKRDATSAASAASASLSAASAAKYAEYAALAAYVASSAWSAAWSAARSAELSAESAKYAKYAKYAAFAEYVASAAEELKSLYKAFEEATK